VSRRVKLPGASELFRPTGGETAVSPIKPVPAEPEHADPPTTEPAPSGGTGRVRHDEKITVYVSREELLALEQARLRLRGELGLAVDRGRLVRAAIAYALSDLESAGPDGEVVRRLTAS
jgi:hypothetical protein